MALTDKLSAIGEAIRYKTGKTTKLTLDQMPAEIRAIVTGSGGGSGGDYDIVVQENDDGTQSLFITDASGSEVVAPVLVTKSVAANGTYNAADEGADGYSSFTVNVPSSDIELNLVPLAISANGIYLPADSNADGFSEITVNVPTDREGIWSDPTIRQMISNRELIESIAIPTDTTVIDRHVFAGLRALKSVYLTNNIFSIGGYAFADCQNLVLYVLPDNIEYIGPRAFQDCKKLQITKTPYYLTAIDVETFDGCTGLTSMTIGENVQTINNYAFRNCTSLNTLIFKGTPNWISETAFEGAAVTEIKVPWSSNNPVIPSNWGIWTNDVNIVYNYTE